jgi:hypothetical protein
MAGGGGSWVAGTRGRVPLEHERYTPGVRYHLECRPGPDPGTFFRGVVQPIFNLGGGSTRAFPV